MNSKERSVLSVTCYGHFLSHFNMLVFPALLLPLSKQFSFSIVDTLSLSFWMYLLFGISALPWGIIADRVGVRPLLAMYHIGAGCSALVAATMLDSPYVFAFALAGIGLFSGIYHPVGLGWIATSVKETSIGMAYNGMFGNLGLAIAPICAGLLNYFYGVGTVYFVVGLLNIGGLVFLVASKNSTQPQKLKKSQSDSSSSLVPFLILLIAMMLGGIVYRATSVSLPAFFELNNNQLFSTLNEQFGSMANENIAATMCTSIIYLVGMLGQYFGGRIGQGYDLKKGYLLFHLITIPMAIGMAYTTNIPLVAFALVHSFFLLGMQPIENTLISRIAPARLMSSAYGTKFILTFGVGALGVKGVEYIKEHTGFAQVFLSLSFVSVLLVCTIVALIIITGSNTRRRQE